AAVFRRRDPQPHRQTVTATVRIDLYVETIFVIAKETAVGIHFDAHRVIRFFVGLQPAADAEVDFALARIVVLRFHKALAGNRLDVDRERTRSAIGAIGPAGGVRFPFDATPDEDFDIAARLGIDG